MVVFTLMPPPTFGPGKMPLTTPVPTSLATPSPNALLIPPYLPGRTRAPPNPRRKRLGPEAIETERTDEVREGFGPGFHQLDLCLIQVSRSTDEHAKEESQQFHREFKKIASKFSQSSAAKRGQLLRESSCFKFCLGFPAWVARRRTIPTTTRPSATSSATPLPAPLLVLWQLRLCVLWMSSRPGYRSTACLLVKEAVSL